jgi:2'-5' RNA ligase
MLHGIASILDPQHTSVVESLWRELEREFGLSFTSFRHPHFTYQVVEQYHVEQTDDTLRRFVRRAIPFTILTNGLGIFTGEAPIIYIPVVRTETLNKFHRVLWEEVSPAAHGIHDHHYAPKHWMPHISLTPPLSSPGQIPEIINFLAGRSFHWEINIDNLALALNVQSPDEVWKRYSLGEGDEQHS